jgi:hypothetical protein
MPRLEIAEAPPWYFSRARRDLLHLARDRRQRFRIRAAYDRGDQAALERDRDADVGMLETQDAVLRPYRVGGGHAPQRSRPGLDDEVIDRQLKGGIAVRVLGSGRIRLFE